MRRSQRKRKRQGSAHKSSRAGLAAKRRSSKRTRSKRKSKLRGISDARLERALRIYSRTNDAKAAANSIRVSVERFRTAAARKIASGKRRRVLSAVRRLPRKMPFFSNGKLLIVTVRARSASLIGRYMSAVGLFLNSNDPKFIEEFKSRSVKDVKGTLHPFETNPNQLYRLSSAGGEPFEEVYRIVL
jgi:hypothetical protein